MQKLLDAILFSRTVDIWNLVFRQGAVVLMDLKHNNRVKGQFHPFSTFYHVIKEIFCGNNKKVSKWSSDMVKHTLMTS